MTNRLLRARIVPFILAILLFAGCGRDESESQPDSIAPQAAPEPTAGMPDHKPDTLTIEGMPEPVTLRLFHRQGLPVATYYPEGDFDPEVVTSAQGSAIHFVASFGGSRNENASIRLFFPFNLSPLNDPSQLETLFVEPDGLADIEGYSIASTSGSASCPAARHTWSLEADDGRIGFACIANQDDNWYLAIASYPAEYGDGFGPRALPIIRELRTIETSAEPDSDPD